MPRHVILALVLISFIAVGLPPPAALAADPASMRALSLRESLMLWKSHSHELELARLQVEGARFDELTAAARPNPTLSVQSIAPLTQRDVNGNDTILGLSQLIERGGKRELRQALAQSATRASEQDWSEVMRTQGVTVMQAYYDLKLAQEILAIDQGMAELYRGSLMATSKRWKDGDVPASAVTRLKVEVARMENQVRQDMNSLRQAQLVLAYYLGVSWQVGVAHQATDPGPEMPPAHAPGIEERLEKRPDVRAAQERLEGARTALELARAQLTRDVTVGVSVERHPLVANTVGVQVSVPLFTNYQYQGEIGKAQTLLTQAQAQIAQVMSQARQEIAQAQSDLETAQDRLLRYENGLLADAERAAINAEFAFHHGASSLVELLDARRTYLTTQIEAVSARADYAKALAAWRAALALMDDQP
ncbi:MAG: TolC family protein [Gammaproteobacteria bacterium]|nr:TolC family protein [Gammaproteobacteria bacterium]